MKKIISVIFLGLMFSSFAHSHEQTSLAGFVSGLSHPILGFDHLLAMVSVGIVSALIGGKAIWMVPVTFVATMLVGGVLGIFGIPLFLVEYGIAFSVLALGVIIASGKQLSVIFSMVFVSLFALFHGHAHGVEMPHLTKPELYIAGFAIATTVIHIAGVFIGLLSQELKRGHSLLRLSGIGIASAGLYFLF